MLEKLFSPPVSISLISTNKCTAECANCCFQCNPRNNQSLSFDDAKNIIDQSLTKFPQSIKLLVITGGECFTLGKELDKIINYASERGLLTRVVTNGYWAYSFKKTYLRLLRLQQIGLTEINVSTGDEHQEFVSLDNIVNIIVASRLLNMTIAINVETSPLDRFSSNMLKNDIRLKKYGLDKRTDLYVVSGKWMYFKKQSKEKIQRLLEFNDKQSSSVIGERCSSILNDIIVFPDKKMYSCCGLTSIYSKYLYLGRLTSHSVAELYIKQFDDFIKIWLYTEGPGKILNFARRKRGLTPLNFKGVHTCQVCVELFKDEENMKIIKDKYKEVLQDVIIKYSFLRKRDSF